LALEPSAMDLIMSYIEFEYLTCSLGFFAGIVSFMLATLCRVIAIFQFSSSRRLARQPELCIVVGGMIMGSLLWWIHLANARLARFMEFRNLGAMVYRFGMLLYARVRNREVGIVGFGALLIAPISLAATIHMLASSMQKCWIGTTHARGSQRTIYRGDFGSPYVLGQSMVSETRPCLS